MIRVSHNQWHEPQEPGRISLRIASGISRHLSGPEPDHVSNTLLPECWLTPWTYRGPGIRSTLCPVSIPGRGWRYQCR